MRFEPLTIAGALVLSIWIYLGLVRGGFWRVGRDMPQLQKVNLAAGIVAVIPARNEAAVIGEAVASLLGQTVRNKLFPDRSPLGQTLHIDRLGVRVIGVLKPKGRSLNGADQDDQVFVPLSL